MNLNNQQTSRVLAVGLALCMMASPSAAQAASSPQGLNQDPKEWVAPKRKARVKNPVPASEASRLSGMKLYEAGCISCHGPVGHGDGAAAPYLQVRPTDLSTALVRKQKDGELYWKISTGRSPMPAFETMYTATERWQIINYIRTLGPGSEVATKLVVPTPGHLLDAVVDQYLVVQAALATDNAAASSKATLQLRRSLSALDLVKEKDISKKDISKWKKLKAEIQAAGLGLGKAKTLNEIRAAFGGFSVTLIAGLNNFGYGGVGKLHGYSCKMALDGAGAVWVQKEKQTSNPYLGKKMTTCGTVGQAIGKVAKPRKKVPTSVSLGDE